MALNSTMSDNTAQAGTGSSISGGVLVAGGNGDSYGGALFNLNGSVTLRYTTLADNRAIVADNTWGGSLGPAAGGAVYNLYLADPGSPAADAGAAATMTVNSSVLASSTDGNGFSISDCVNNDGTFTSGYDVVQNPGTTCTFDNNDQNVVPLLATSAATANGGPTPTLALTRYSPAINSGDTGTTLGPVPTSDQRGYPRDAEPDIGAFDYIPRATVTPPPPPKTSGGGEFGLTGLASLAAFALLVLALRRRRPYKR